MSSAKTLALVRGTVEKLCRGEWHSPSQYVMKSMSTQFEEYHV